MQKSSRIGSQSASRHPGEAATVSTGAHTWRATCWCTRSADHSSPTTSISNHNPPQ